MIASSLITLPVGPIAGVGLFGGRPCELTIGLGDEAGIIFHGWGPQPYPFAPARVNRVTYDTGWSGLPREVPIRNTTLNASGRLEPSEPLPHPPRYVMATVEHLLSALWGLGVRDAVVAIEGSEVPILDGSSKPFVDAIRAHLSPAPLSVEPIILREQIEVRDGNAAIVATPSAGRDEFSLTYQLDYGPGSPLKPQSATWRGDPSDFASNIAPARTFSLKAEAEAAQKLGLFKHLSARDMLVIGDDGEPIDNEWRMENEPARHKLLDLIGDLALLGRPLIADVVATRSGHRLTHELCRAILAAGH